MAEQEGGVGVTGETGGTGKTGETVIQCHLMSFNAIQCHRKIIINFQLSIVNYPLGVTPPHTPVTV